MKALSRVIVQLFYSSATEPFATDAVVSIPVPRLGRPEFFKNIRVAKR
jgi:hypothetical protein